MFGSSHRRGFVLIVFVAGASQQIVPTRNANPANSAPVLSKNPAALPSDVHKLTQINEEKATCCLRISTHLPSTVMAR
jgi:hypothetical protein